ncbi:MAG: hypothetical protein M1308_24345 [Actinobacteria bacterium]|nr:hypothetical protein [Actinomycetota bacterium]
MKRISFFVREDQFESINKLSDLKNISSSELIREAIDCKLLTEFGRSSKEQPKERAVKETRGLLKERFKKDLKSEEITNAVRAEWEQRIERNKKH